MGGTAGRRGPRPPQANIDLLPIYERRLDDLLTPQMARAVRLRYGMKNGLYRTLGEVATEMGITAPCVRSLEWRAFRRMRDRRRLYEQMYLEIQSDEWVTAA